MQLFVDCVQCSNTGLYCVFHEHVLFPTETKIKTKTKTRIMSELNKKINLKLFL